MFLKDQIFLNYFADGHLENIPVKFGKNSPMV